MNKNIYSDIAQRTGGDIYIGVVGPVRTGKSTLIKRFMDTLVLPNIENEFKKERALDELPQSAAGKTIMTTEPKFVPEEAVEIKLPGGINFKVRMIDCVGYIVPSAIGYAEGENPRMVITPWYENEIPFDLAAEIGTKKVISEHSTIGLVVTTDGSISDIDRFEYEEAEERVIAELKAIDKPYVILLNSREPQSGSVLALATELAEKYHAPVLPVNCSEIDENTIKSILSQILFEFPIKEVAIDMPSWLIGLSKDHWLKSAIYDAIKTSAENLVHIRDVTSLANEIDNCEYVSASKVDGIELGVGGAKVSIVL
jgi:stage IV sporulation protein A